MVQIGRLGVGGSDYTAFVQHIGVPSVDVSYTVGDYPVYHSMYDDFTWMEEFGNPMFHRHVAVASIWGFLALQFADNEIWPFNYLSYAEKLWIYAPSKHNDYGSMSYPWIDDGIENAMTQDTAESWQSVQHEA
ncbi:unnamed protein product [Linum tenue]|uniref:Peptidase M28 domain-containing protein n=1 Tax=Linum tenue TaxID=586396 RepID=A0AAV0S7R7_9ROSI|nr:unnamed protein product [Linum tenue]